MNLYILYAMNFLFGFATTIGMSIIPLLAVDMLAMSFFAIGALEGFSEVSSNVVKYYFGNKFDKNKKNIFVYPAVFALIAKVALFYPHYIALFVAKYCERISNGQFAPTRDASVPFFAKREKIGAANSFMNLCKYASCCLAPLSLGVCAYCFGELSNYIYTIIFVSCCLCFVAVILSTQIKTDNYIIKEKDCNDQKDSVKYTFSAIAFVFFICRFNDGLLILFLKSRGFAEWYYVATIGIFNFFMMIASPIFGYLHDKSKQKLSFCITFLSMSTFALCFIYLIYSQSYIVATVGLAAWGVQRCGANLVFVNMLQVYCKKQSIGHNIGVWCVISGAAMFLASITAGYVAQYSFLYIFVTVFVISLLLSVYMYFSDIKKLI